MTKRAAICYRRGPRDRTSGAEPRPQHPRAAKRAEAQQVLEQIHALDMQVEQAIEEYNAAKIELDQIHKEQRDNARHLALAKASFRRPQSTLQGRLLALYTGGETSTLEILLGATSLSDFLSRTDTVNRVSKQDVRIVREIQAAKDEMRDREAALKKAQARQTAVVADLASQKSSIEGQLAQRQQLLSTIKNEIAAIEAAEAKRQARLRELAEQRLAEHAFVARAVRPAGDLRRRRSASADARRRRRDRDALPRRPVRLGRRLAERLRLLRARRCTSTRRSASRSRTTRRCSTATARRSPAHQLAPGDLVFFNGLGHMGIYIGGGQFIHAPHTGDVVKISSLERLVVLELRTTAPAASSLAGREARGRAERFRSAPSPVVVSEAAMRTIWNGSINFGLVNIPIGLAVAQQRKDISFRTLHRECGTPIKQKRWCPKHERDVEPEELVKGWEFAKGQFVIVEESDLEAVALQRSQAIEIDRSSRWPRWTRSTSTARTTSRRPTPTRSGARICCSSRR